MKAIAVRFSITQVIAVILIFLFVKKPSQLNLIAAFEGMASVVALAWTVAYLKGNYRIGIGRISVSKTRKIIAGSTPFFISLAASALMSSTVTVLMGVSKPMHSLSLAGPSRRRSSREYKPYGSP